MVFFIITRAGYKSFLSLNFSGSCALWLGGSILTPAEELQFDAAPIALTYFDDEISPDDLGRIQECIETIQLHHPGKVIWAESQGLG
ncbi:hypothetical protein [Chitinimonas sp.]|uniref:hypothetical protein n=1 Tax=Chitinimonas sp. TaxID=1934313 RepID=UPI002F92A585